MSLFVSPQYLYWIAGYLYSDIISLSAASVHQTMTCDDCLDICDNAVCQSLSLFDPFLEEKPSHDLRYFAQVLVSIPRWCHCCPSPACGNFRWQHPGCQVFIAPLLSAIVSLSTDHWCDMYCPLRSRSLCD